MKKIVLIGFLLTFCFGINYSYGQKTAHHAVPYGSENNLLNELKGDITYNPSELITVNYALTAGADYLVHAQADVT